MADIVLDINVNNKGENSNAGANSINPDSALLSVITRLESAIDRLASKLENIDTKSKNRSTRQSEVSSSTVQERIKEATRYRENIIYVPPGGFGNMPPNYVPLGGYGNLPNLPAIYRNNSYLPTVYRSGSGSGGDGNIPPKKFVDAEYDEIPQRRPLTPAERREIRGMIGGLAGLTGLGANAYMQDITIPQMMLSGATGLNNMSVAQNLIQQNLISKQANLATLGGVIGAGIGSVGGPLGIGIGAGLGATSGSFLGKALFGSDTATAQRNLTLQQMAFQSQYRGFGGANAANIYNNIANVAQPALSPDFWRVDQLSSVAAYQNVSLASQRGRGLTTTQATNIANLYNVNAGGMSNLGMAENFGINALNLAQQAGSRGLDVGAIAAQATDLVTRGGLSGTAASNIALRTSTMGAPFQQQIMSYYSNPVLNDLRNRLMASAVGENYGNLMTTGS